MRILALGGTGSVGKLVVRHALDQGHDVVVLTRKPLRANIALPSAATVVKGDVTTSAGLTEALDGVDAIISTLDGDPETTEFGGVHNVLTALAGRRVHFVLMSSIATNNAGRLDVLDWKRRGERLVRVSGNDFTIVRPGWFDAQPAGHQALTFAQTYKLWDIGPGAAAIGRQQIARTLVAAAGNPAANQKTFDLFASPGTAPTELDPQFAALTADPVGALDGSYDRDDLPFDRETTAIQAATADVTASR